VPDNPARWDDLKAMGFEAPAKLSKGNHPSLPYDQMPAFIATLRARDGIAARALEFLILINVRTDAVLKAAWDEFDLDQAVWRTSRTGGTARRAFACHSSHAPSRSFATCSRDAFLGLSFLGGLLAGLCPTGRCWHVSSA
jgi:hypothetical protein